MLFRSFYFTSLTGHDGKTGLSTEDLSAVGSFVAKSVAPKTLQVYNKHWVDWCSFVEATMECQGDPLLSG